MLYYFIAQIVPALAMGSSLGWLLCLTCLHSPVKQKVNDGKREGSTVREVHQVIEGIGSKTRGGGFSLK